jgi:DNA repair photolyase
VYIRNPFKANQINEISLRPEDVGSFIFWTRNPKKFIDKLDKLNKYYYYFQFTVTPYTQEIEPNVPAKNEIIKTFQTLSERLGREKMIWRYDPILLSGTINLSYHLMHFEFIAKQLHKFTEKCIISFLDMYKKCERNLKNTDVTVPDRGQIIQLSGGLKSIAQTYDLKLETCAEEIDLLEMGISHGRCIDNELIERITGRKIITQKDKNQRKACGCIESIDIGTYNTCIHGCLYCYANSNIKTVEDNFNAHNSKSPLLVGEISSKDIIKRHKNVSSGKKI